MPLSGKKKETNARWNKENMVRLGVNVTRSYADQIRAKAADEGRSVHSILKAALDAFLAAPAPLAADQEDQDEDQQPPTGRQKTE